VINFGLIYGMSAFGLAKALGIDNTAAEDYIERYFQRFAGVQALHGRAPAPQAKAQGYVETVFGRRLYLPEINSPNGPRRARRRARSHQCADAGHGGRPDQAQHGARCSRSWSQEGRGTRMIMQVHDELVFEVPEAEVDWLRDRSAAHHGQAWRNCKVPLLAEVGVGANWDQAH
jgi:DNA polymerase-1